MQTHLRTQVEELILRWDGVVAAMHRNIMPMTALYASPICLLAIDAVTGAINTIFIGDAIENIEFKLRSPTAFIGDTGRSKIFFSLDGNIARVVGENQVGIRFQGSADKAKRGSFPKWITHASG